MSYYNTIFLFCTHFCTLIFIFFWLQYVIGGVIMKKLKIENTSKANDTITRTIRISGSTFDKINELAEKNNLSFNSVINQIIEYGLSNLED